MKTLLVVAVLAAVLVAGASASVDRADGMLDLHATLPVRWHGVGGNCPTEAPRDVACAATDSSGNTGRAQFTVRVTRTRKGK